MVNKFEGLHIKKMLLLISLLFIFSLTFVSSSNFVYDTVKTTTGGGSSSFSLFIGNVTNHSQLDGLQGGTANERYHATLAQTLFWYNMTLASGGGTYNATYALWAYNQTYGGSTYNETYATWSYNQSLYSSNLLNTTYGLYWYNMSDGSYNATYDLYAYNMSRNNYSHNSLEDIQGGDGIGEYYHLNEAEHDGVAINFLNWITNQVTDLVYYYNKSEVYNQSEIDAIVQTINGSVDLPISADDINKTAGTQFVGETLTYIIDTIQDYVDDVLSRLGILEPKVDGLINDTTIINNTLAIHLTNLTNPHKVTTGQIGAVDLTTNQNVNGVKTFLVFPKSSTLNPLNDYEFATKYYTDQLFTFALSWKNPVRTANDTVEPVSPTNGMRYIINTTGAVGNWTNYGNNITQYNGSNWIFIAPEVGDALLVLNVNKGYVWNGAEWIIFNQPITYSATDGVILVDTTFKANLMTSGGLNLSGTAIGVSYDSKTLYIDPQGTLAIKPGSINDTYVNILSWTKINKSGSKLSDLGDVSDSAPADGQVLTWSSGTSEWVPLNPTGGSGSSGANTTYDLTIFAYPPGYTWTYNSSVPAEFYSLNNQRARKYYDLPSASYFRIGFNKGTTIIGNHTLNAEYSLNNGTTWKTLNITGDNRFYVNDSACKGVVANCLSNWTIIDPNARQNDVLLRIMALDWIGGGTKSVSEIYLQFKMLGGGQQNITYVQETLNYTNYHYNYSVNIGDTNVSLYTDRISIISGTYTGNYFANLAVAFGGEVYTPTTRRFVDLTHAIDYKVTCTQTVAGHPGSRVFIQYSLNQVNWYNLSRINDGTDVLNISTGTGIKNTTWYDINDSAKGWIYMRVAGGGGNGSTDPGFGEFTILVRKVIGINISTITSANDYNHTLASYDNFYNKTSDINTVGYNITANSINLTGKIKSDITPETTGIFSLGTSLLKWLKGYFTYLDATNINSSIINVSTGINLNNNATISRNSTSTKMWFDETGNVNIQGGTG